MIQPEAPTRRFRRAVFALEFLIATAITILFTLAILAPK
jgi:hypothetical protein